MNCEHCGQLIPPADDGEPVTEAWWDSLVLWEEPEGRCIGIRICLNPTRGQVRRLLAALGLA